ncbi:cupin domain-containing protein [Pannus brasiliensis CCIBt3594]|uniref:Cupin domain-containing protein n=1 Tax=Pannus brasiliensis CCIBt3594 TaxID=1427578 RepID=A0AAW9QX23_9CHRO
MKRILFFLPLVGLSWIGTLAIAREIQKPDDYRRSVTREVLASGLPGDATGKILELVRYTIPPRAKLPAHIHPGMQIERVESGTLTYTVVKGKAFVKRSNGPEEAIEEGKTILLNPGDSLTEPAGMVHYGENATDFPVILLGASLFDTDKPKAILLAP